MAWFQLSWCTLSEPIEFKIFHTLEFSLATAAPLISNSLTRFPHWISIERCFPCDQHNLAQALTLERKKKFQPKDKGTCISTIELRQWNLPGQRELDFTSACGTAPTRNYFGGTWWSVKFNFFALISLYLPLTSIVYDCVCRESHLQIGIFAWDEAVKILFKDIPLIFIFSL